uniref:Uncharacterized protein n=1 Tax=Arundo donax TaxID=35708 RepID=A0A0A9FV14_ARUDO
MENAQVVSRLQIHTEKKNSFVVRIIWTRSTTIKKMVASSKQVSKLVFET